MGSMAARGTNSRRKTIAVAVAVAFVYASTFRPSDWVRNTAQTLAGSHPYEGVWVFIPHLLFYCTFTALLAAVCWFILAKSGAINRPGLKISTSVVLWALAGGAISVLASLAFLHTAGMGQLGWRGFGGWKIAGNVFSNFFEEFIFRGFLLVGLTQLIRFWPAAILTSLAFGFGHEQYPPALQIFIACTSVFWCWIVRESRSLWAAWGAHMIVDIVIDAIWG